MRKKLFAWGIHQVMKLYEPLISAYKAELFQSIQGNVLEIGPGTGPNLKHMPKGIHWTGLEPNQHMHPYLLKQAESLRMDVSVVADSAMKIPMPDESFDCVVGTLVLCSVPDPDDVLREIHRVLRPGGTYRFIEHVAAEPGSIGSMIQRVVKPLWSCCADGCTLDRRSWEPIERAQFSKIRMERFALPFPVISPHLAGYAVR